MILPRLSPTLDKNPILLVLIVASTSIKITVDRLQPGLHIRLPVKWNEHPFLFNSFKIQSVEQIQLIKHLGIQHVFLNLAQSDTSPLPLDSEPQTVAEPTNLDEQADKLWQEKEQRIEKLNCYRRQVLECEKEFERSLARMRAIMNKIRSRPTDAIDEASALVEEIVDKLLSDENVTLHLMNSKSEFEDIYFHSLNVSVISMMIAKAKGLSELQIKQIAFAALFHDIGKIRVPSAIVRKTTPLTEPEKIILSYTQNMA